MVEIKRRMAMLKAPHRLDWRREERSVVVKPPREQVRRAGAAGRKPRGSQAARNPLVGPTCYECMLSPRRARFTSPLGEGAAAPRTTTISRKLESQNTSYWRGQPGRLLHLQRQLESRHKQTFVEGGDVCHPGDASLLRPEYLCWSLIV